VFWFLIAIVYCWRLWSAAGILQQGSIGAFQATAARLVPKGLRDPAAWPSNSTVSSLCLTHNGCRVAGGNVSVAAGVVRVDFAAQEAADGYFFSTAEAGPAGLDPVQWVLEASRDGGGLWETVGASCWRQYSDGSVGFYPHLPFPTPGDRGSVVQIDYRIPWEWGLDAVAANSIYAAGWFAATASGLVGREHVARNIILWMSCAAALVFFVEALGYLLANEGYTALSVLIEYGPSQAVWIVGLAFFESKLMHMLLWFGLTVLCTLLARDVALYQRPATVPLFSFLSSSAFIVMIFVALAICFRWRSIRQAVRLVAEDKFRYDAVWEDLMRDEAAFRRLTDLRKLAEDAQRRCCISARQFNRKFLSGACRCRRGCLRSGFGWAGLSCGSQPDLAVTTGPASTAFNTRMTIAGSVDPSNPLRSLDQLFVQASCLEPLLRRKVKVYATGGLAVNDLAGFVRLLFGGCASSP
jgi:hypothetical protein